jgi:hypothetical protein
LQKKNPTDQKKPIKLKQTQNGHFELLKYASLIPIDHIINDEYICDHKNNKNINKTKKYIDF